jgi:hypothetical protein
MATVVNNPQPAPSADNGNGFLLGVIILLIAVLAFFYYGLPVITSGFGGGTQVTVPEQIDVNVQQPK